MAASWGTDPVEIGIGGSIPFSADRLGVFPGAAILVAGEPTGERGATTGRGMVDLLCGLKRGRGATLVLVTHDPGLARLCDRTVRLRAGRIEEPVAA